MEKNGRDLVETLVQDCASLFDILGLRSSVLGNLFGQFSIQEHILTDIKAILTKSGLSCRNLATRESRVEWGIFARTFCTAATPNSVRQMDSDKKIYGNYWQITFGTESLHSESRNFWLKCTIVGTRQPLEAEVCDSRWLLRKSGERKKGQMRSYFESDF